MKRYDKALFESKATVLKALGHPTRLWLAEQMADKEKCVSELAASIEADLSTVSKHLAILKQAGVIRDQKRGKQVYYELKVPCILKYLSCVEAIILAQAEEHQALFNRNETSVCNMLPEDHSTECPSSCRNFF